MSTWIVLGLIGITLFFLVVLYNRLVALRQTVRQAFSDIDVQLKQRFDLVPNLVETVKTYASHERELLQNVTDARARAMNAGNPQERIQAEGALGLALTNLMAVAENYPDLKANQNFMSLSDDLMELENKLAAARRFYNNAVSEYNTAQEQFPAVLVARAFGFTPSEFFDVSEAEKKLIEQPVKVAF